MKITLEKTGENSFRVIGDKNGCLYFMGNIEKDKYGTWFEATNDFALTSDDLITIGQAMKEIRGSTNQKDKNGREIFYGDTLKCDYGYRVVVVKIEDAPFGRLICKSDHPCANIPFALNPDISEVE